jgi:Cytochrome c554 and c-prime
MLRPILALLALCYLPCSFDGQTGAASQSSDRISPGTWHQSDVSEKNRGETRSKEYIGDTGCASCHQDKGATYMHTAHHLTSQLPSEGSILGSFSEGSNGLKIADPAPAIGDPGLYYTMETKDSGFYQTATTGFPGQMHTQSERIDIVVGSGVRGQSYLYWRGDELFELPVSYWSDGRQWINSPGFRNGPPNFDRVVTPRCLECHVTYIESRSDESMLNRYDKTSLVTGISCEICHGPGAEHVAVHRVRRSDSAISSQTILNPATFSRDRQVDLCALCHSGAQFSKSSRAFYYVPGEPLEKYLGPNSVDLEISPDVHANQVGLLKRSRCYLSSPKMSCSTCHQVHAPERAAASYSARCLSCHRVENCGVEKKMGPKIANNCIDCHMPVEQTNAIVSETRDKLIRTTMRTHWIKIYLSAEQP